jgi:HAE1 family hydrophobic/amphiphilic exporter-1
MPDVAYPFINVSVKYPGASPDTMANNVATPLEREFLTISGLLQVSSNNILGSSSLILQFALDRDIDAAALDVQSAIARATPFLPPNLPTAPTFKKVNPSQDAIIYYSLISETLTEGELYDYANTYIGQRLALIEGVAEIQIYGSAKAVRVQVDPGKMASLGITIDEVSRAIIEGNPYLPVGALDGPDTSETIIAYGQMKEAKYYDPLIIKYRGNSPVRIQDIGKAINSEQDYKPSRTYHSGGKTFPAVTVAVKPQPGSNVVQIAKDVDKLIPSIIPELPPSVTLKKIWDRSESVQESTSDVQMTLVIAFILVVLIIFLYLGNLTETIIPIIVLPMSVIGTFAIMRMLNFSLDNLSLMALILSIGFIIDDAIVVIENIVRHVEAGESPWKAAMEGSKQIGFTIVSMTLSLIAVFIPILFMSGLLGKVLAEFALTLTAITILSGFISLTLTPMLCSIFIHQRDVTDKEKRPHLGQRINQKMLDYYKPSLKWILENSWISILLLIGCTLLSGYFLIILPKDFLPPEDYGLFFGYTQSAQGTSSEKMKELQEEIAKVIDKDPNIDNFISVVPLQSYRNGIVVNILKPKKDRKPLLEVISELSKKTREIIGVNIFYKTIPMIDLSVGFQVKGAYQYKLQSLNPEELYPIAKEFESRMKAMPELQGVNSDLEIDTPQLFFNINRDKASTLGITALNIENALLLGYSGNRVSTINTPINQYDVVLELNPAFQKYPASLDLLYLRSNTTNQMVPLRAVADWNLGIGPNSVNHINQFPSVTISFNLMPGVSLGTILDQLDKIASEILPKNVSGQVLGTAQTFREAVDSAGLLLPITILVIYLVLGALYESYIHPITILTTLPPATLGGVLILYFTGYSLSLYSFLGIILLIGIVKKNGIMMIDFAIDNIRTKGDAPEKAIYDACVVRFRPIMMTTLTAIMGALPIVFGLGTGAESRRPLGLVIVGGLLLSQILTLYMTPVLYIYLEKLNKKLTILPGGKQHLGEVE